MPRRRSRPHRRGERSVRHPAELRGGPGHTQCGTRRGFHTSMVNMHRFALFDIMLVGRSWKISPYVRKLRLAVELRALRAGAGLTHEQLAKRIGESRAQISRLENGHVVDQADVMKILDALGVTGERWTQLMTITREAGEKGWWESTRGMGDRQARSADLEAGATTIREYHQTFLPGLLQIAEYVRVQTEVGVNLEPSTFTADGVLAGRAAADAAPARRAQLRGDPGRAGDQAADRPARHRQEAALPPRHRVQQQPGAEGGAAGAAGGRP